MYFKYKFWTEVHKSLVDNYSVLVPPDTFSNSEVKRHSGNDSVGFPYVKVAHYQPFISEKPSKIIAGLFF